MKIFFDKSNCEFLAYQNNFSGRLRHQFPLFSSRAFQRKLSRLRNILHCYTAHLLLNFQQIRSIKPIKSTKFSFFHYFSTHIYFCYQSTDKNFVNLSVVSFSIDTCFSEANSKVIWQLSASLN